MAVNEDIIKGVRRGAILLAALLIGVATYRILHEVFQDSEDTPPEPSAPVAEIAPVLGPPVVPPPPPLPGEVHRRMRRRRQVQAPPIEPAVKIEPSPPSQPVVVAPMDDPPEESLPSLEREEEAPMALVPEEDGEERQTLARKHRWLRAVGRFLRIVKTDAQTQALR